MALGFTGCQSLCTSTSRIDVQRIDESAVVNGSPDQTAWTAAKATPLRLVAMSSERQRIGKVEKKASVRFLHDSKNLYIAFSAEDEDLVDASQRDGQALHTLSDVVEIFLKPVDEPWYWEIHLTPKGRVSTYWWPSRGYVGLGSQPSVLPRFIKSSTRVQGTINQSQDHDQGWTAFVTIPFAQLERSGPPRDPSSRWTILVTRYDYSRFRMKGTGPELSATAALPEPNFHLVNEYPRLQLRD